VARRALGIAVTEKRGLPQKIDIKKREFPFSRHLHSGVVFTCVKETWFGAGVEEAGKGAANRRG